MTNETIAKELYQKVGEGGRRERSFDSDSELLDDINTALNQVRKEVLEEVKV